MKLFKVVKWQLLVSEEAWGLLPFKILLDRDKSKGKELALKEMLFIYYFCDVKSNYLHMSEIERTSEIIRDVGLPEDWEIDPEMKVAIVFYRNKSQTVIEKLYTQSLQAASDIGDYLANAGALLRERDKADRPVNDISKITSAVQKVPKLMADLKAAYKEVVKEQEDNENKKKGSKSFNTFEDGF
jgi:hypothetical protein|tara:strand:- start:2007 stop:2561 length:555 start_codon:yes stop_codon:yes gene_type:complete